MTGVVVIGKTLANARAYSEKCGLRAQIISPQSFHTRFNGLRVDQFYVTREAFRHPNIRRTVLTVQTFMRHQGDPMTPTIGRIVHYTINEHDAAQINKRRKDAKNLNAAGVTLASQELGAQIHVGNEVRAGEQYPATIVRVFEAAKSANLRVWLDGNDDFWACSVSEGDGGRQWSWPPRT